jgi:hypothetical protein
MKTQGAPNYDGVTLCLTGGWVNQFITFIP